MTSSSSLRLGKVRKRPLLSLRCVSPCEVDLIRRGNIILGAFCRVGRVAYAPKCMLFLKLYFQVDMLAVEQVEYQPASRDVANRN